MEKYLDISGNTESCLGKYWAGYYMEELDLEIILIFDERYKFTGCLEAEDFIHITEDFDCPKYEDFPRKGDFIEEAEEDLENYIDLTWADRHYLDEKPFDELIASLEFLAKKNFIGEAGTILELEGKLHSYVFGYEESLDDCLENINDFFGCMIKDNILSWSYFLGKTDHLEVEYKFEQPIIFEEYENMEYKDIREKIKEIDCSIVDIYLN